MHIPSSFMSFLSRAPPLSPLFPYTTLFRSVATTRAETMLGDTGVAVHPDDERHRHLVGTEIELPLTGRRIPIVADPHVDPEFGRSEEHTSELQSRENLVCRLLLEKKKNTQT